MVKPRCNVVKKIITKREGTKTIGRFMKKTTFKRKAHYLKTLCAEVNYSAMMERKKLVNTRPNIFIKTTPSCTSKN